MAMLCDGFDIRVFLTAASALAFDDPFRGSTLKRCRGSYEHAS
jgi:hypothetical protein